MSSELSSGRALSEEVCHCFLCVSAVWTGAVVGLLDSVQIFVEAAVTSDQVYRFTAFTFLALLNQVLVRNLYVR